MGKNGQEVLLELPGPPEAGPPPAVMPPSAEALPVYAAPDESLGENVKPNSRRFLPPQFYAERTKRTFIRDITVGQIVTFLDQLEKTGQWEISATRAGVRGSHIREIIKKDDEFRHAVEESERKFVEKRVAQVDERAFEGWDEPVWSHKTGMLLGTVKRFSDRLAEIRIKKLDPSHRDNVEVDVRVSGGVIVVPAPPLSEAEFLKQYQNPQIIDAATPPAPSRELQHGTENKQ